MDVFKLSRNWFDFSFENPEKIKPIHTALYFFAIEHSNRLGWKKKFGIPTEMAKDAIGVKSWHVYIAAFNDLINWGFFELIERSKNQYSSNIIALIENDKALDKALDKAMIKHASKQQQSTHQSIYSINIQETRNKKQETNISTWKNNFEIYKNDLRDAFNKILTHEYILEREKYHPGLDIRLTIEKSCKDFWAKESGWKNKKRAKCEMPDWQATFNNSLSQKINQVWKSKNEPDFQPKYLINKL